MYMAVGRDLTLRNSSGIPGVATVPSSSIKGRILVPSSPEVVVVAVVAAAALLLPAAAAVLLPAAVVAAALPAAVAAAAASLLPAVVVAAASSLQAVAVGTLVLSARVCVPSGSHPVDFLACHVLGKIFAHVIEGCFEDSLGAAGQPHANARHPASVGWAAAAGLVPSHALNKRKQGWANTPHTTPITSQNLQTLALGRARVNVDVVPAVRAVFAVAQDNVATANPNDHAHLAVLFDRASLDALHQLPVILGFSLVQAPSKSVPLNHLVDKAEAATFVVVLNGRSKVLHRSMHVRLRQRF